MVTFISNEVMGVQQGAVLMQEARCLVCAPKLGAGVCMHLKGRRHKVRSGDLRMVKLAVEGRAQLEQKRDSRRRLCFQFWCVL